MLISAWDKPTHHYLKMGNLVLNQQLCYKTLRHWCPLNDHLLHISTYIILIKRLFTRIYNNLGSIILMNYINYLDCGICSSHPSKEHQLLSLNGEQGERGTSV
jgi:hypothetical protein